MSPAAGEVPAARRVALNALSPFAAQIATKVLMLGYVIVQFRLLGGSGTLGDYFLAGTLLLYTGTVADWGLSTLLTREVAKSRDARIADLFQHTLALRLAISLALFAPVALFLWIYLTQFGLTEAGAWAVVVLTLSLLPSAFSGSVTAVLYAHERMTLPAGIGIATAVLNVALGIGALLLGWGVVGLALSALASTLATAGFFLYVLRRDFPWLPVAPDIAALRGNSRAALDLLKTGWPLMLNALLVGLFFRIDEFIIKPSEGGVGLEKYRAAYSFLTFVLLITPAATMALFPRMARHAASDRPRLAYEYSFALKVLLLISVPIIALTVWFAPLLITIVTGGKAEYLPDSAVALQILIFFLPLSFVNGVTQYVLIALDLQRLITRAFALTVAFNVAANLLLVPLLGINGAAITTILSEAVLLVPFMMWTGREIGRVPLAEIAMRPLLAGIAVAGAGWLLRGLTDGWQSEAAGLAAYIAGGLFLGIVYLAALAALRPFTGTEMQTLKSALRRG